MAPRRRQKRLPLATVTYRVEETRTAERLRQQLLRLGRGFTAIRTSPTESYARRWWAQAFAPFVRELSKERANVLLLRLAAFSSAFDPNSAETVTEQDGREIVCLPADEAAVHARIGEIAVDLGLPYARHWPTVLHAAFLALYDDDSATPLVPLLPSDAALLDAYWGGPRYRVQFSPRESHAQRFRGAARPVYECRFRPLPGFLAQDDQRTDAKRQIRSAFSQTWRRAQRAGTPLDARVLVHDADVVERDPRSALRRDTGMVWRPLHLHRLVTLQSAADSAEGRSVPLSAALDAVVADLLDACPPITTGRSERRDVGAPVRWQRTARWWAIRTFEPETTIEDIAELEGQHGADAFSAVTIRSALRRLRRTNEMHNPPGLSVESG